MVYLLVQQVSVQGRREKQLEKIFFKHFRKYQKH